MLESSAPSVLVSDWQFDIGFAIPSTFKMHVAPSSASVFATRNIDYNSREVILDLIDRASQKNSVGRKDILNWIDDIALYSPGIIFAAGQMIRTENEVHIIAVSTSERMMKRMQEKIRNKPNGVWAYYLTLADSNSGIITPNMNSIPLWLRGILSGEHIFITTDDDVYGILKKLRIDSVLKINAASEIILTELAFLDVYRKFAKRMPADSNLASLVLRSELEAMYITGNTLLCECDIALRARNVKNECRKKAIKYVADYLAIRFFEELFHSKNSRNVDKDIAIGPEELSKYHSSIVNLEKVKKRTPPPLSARAFKKGNIKQIV